MLKKLHKLFYEIEDTHWWSVGIRDIQLSLLGKYNHLRKPQILDVGCGTGATLKALGQIGRATGIDSQAYALDFCRKRGLENIVQGNCEKLPWPAKKFDIVTMFDVIEHIQDDDQALREAGRVLRSAGLLEITVPAFMFLWDDHDRMNHHYRRYTRSNLHAKVSAAGFETLFISYCDTFLFPFVLPVKLINRILKRHHIFNNKPVHPLVNAILYRIFSAEKYLFPAVSLPFGVSLVCVARKQR